ncbi:uncharacterized protein C16orf78 homolog isoform X1 [Fukomys damarensis]|uniref:uncharacterized protein C16orf78 homolog isoform X1 n=1 Tax=Fukomys damarensis TaxID=885580 RepID=UPI00054009F4|nr:uncharacterized protein C16orf78 homolog isoform X1 [Fukomys damarensis]
MSEKPEDPKEPKDLKDLMPTERKTVWRTAAERKMSDLARELEWLERRKGKKKQPVQKQKVVVMEPPKAKMKEGKKVKGIKKQQERSTKMKLQEQTAGPGSRGRTGSTTLYQRPFGGEQRRLSIFTGTHDKDGARRSDFFPGYISQQEILNFKNWIRVRQARHLRHKIKGGTQTRVLALYLHEPEELDIKDAVTLESTPRSNTFRRQSLYADPSIQDNAFGNRRMTMMKDWPARTSDIAFERKLKSLMEKGTEPKIENVKMLKPEEVLSCRYLRLSENNIRTLLKLCKDVGLNMDIHPHMTETEIDVQKVFPPKCSSTTP